MKAQSVYDIVTERIIALLEQGTIPWQKPWHGGEQAPQNLISRRPYRGINVFLLSAMQYQSPCWLTYKQAAGLGGHVKQGEKACPVIFWKWLDVDDKTTGDKQKIPLLRYYSAFNVAQCDGIPLDKIPALSEPQREHSPIAEGESIVAGMPKRPEIKHGLARAFYSPVSDFVGMPNPEQFKSAEDYYSVLFHELTHSTGAATRLNRKGVSGSDGNWSAYGSTPYAREELVAEMGSAYLSAEAGFFHRTVENTSAYINAWLQRLKDDAKLVVQAAAQAQHAADFILNRQAAGENHTEAQPEAMAA